MERRRSGNEQFPSAAQTPTRPMAHAAEATISGCCEQPSPTSTQDLSVWIQSAGDWDGFSDTDLLVVALTQEAANHWADLLLDHGVAQDVIGLDQEAWVQLPHHPSVIWRHVARDAVSLLDQEPTA